MNAEFQDLQHQDNPHNGETLRDQRSVMALLEELRDVSLPFMCQFAGDNEFNLTVGIDRDFGCVQHSANDGSPPYLMAIAPAASGLDRREMTFLVGDTATPIDGRYRLPISLVKEIVADFVTSGKRSENIVWEEFGPSR